MQTPEQKRSYHREYWKTPKRQEYIKQYRSTEEYRAKRRDIQRRYWAKRKAGLSI